MMKTTDMIKVIEAFREGKRIQYRKRDFSRNWREAPTPSWDFYTSEYRVTPEPKKVPLTPEDLPDIVWFSDNGDGVYELVKAINNKGITVGITGYSYVHLMNPVFKYSSDRKNWKPWCKEVESDV